MKPYEILSNGLIVYPIPEPISWNKELPNHLTLELEDVGKVTEPIYLSGFDDKESAREFLHKHNIIGTITAEKTDIDLSEYINAWDDMYLEAFIDMIESETFFKLCEWMEVEPNYFIKSC